LDLSRQLQQLEVSIIPGQKLCPSCRNICSEKLNASEECFENPEIGTCEEDFMDENQD